MLTSSFVCKRTKRFVNVFVCNNVYAFDMFFADKIGCSDYNINCKAGVCYLFWRWANFLCLQNFVNQSEFIIHATSFEAVAGGSVNPIKW